MIYIYIIDLCKRQTQKYNVMLDSMYCKECKCCDLRCAFHHFSKDSGHTAEVYGLWHRVARSTGTCSMESRDQSILGWCLLPCGKTYNGCDLSRVSGGWHDCYILQLDSFCSYSDTNYMALCVLSKRWADSDESTKNLWVGHLFIARCSGNSLQVFDMDLMKECAHVR